MVLDLRAVIPPLVFDRLLPFLDGVPEVVLDDAQLRGFLDDPFGLGVGPRLALAGVRILDEALAVPDQLADIHLVVEDAVAALLVAVDGAEAPIPAGGGLHPVMVQFDRDPLGRLPGGIVAEDGRTTSACTGLMVRSPRTASPLASNFFTTS